MAGVGDGELAVSTMAKSRVPAKGILLPLLITAPAEPINQGVKYTGVCAAAVIWTRKQRWTTSPAGRTLPFRLVSSSRFEPDFEQP